MPKKDTPNIIIHGMVSYLTDIVKSPMNNLRPENLKKLMAMVTDAMEEAHQERESDK